MDYAKNMRVFHNKVKQQLISNACQYTQEKYKKLLDIGCGRGGDLFKWDKSNIRYVYGYDPNASYIDEANRRFHNSSLKRDYVFSTEEYNSFENYFDIVSCQFAIHYMFSDDTTLDNHLAYVCRMLKPGGVYIGTFMDGDRVLEILGDTNCYTNQAMCVRTVRNSENGNTGIPLCVHLSGTLYFGEQSVSHEFLVKKDILTTQCAAHGLRLIKYTPFQEYNNQMNFRMGPDFSECSYLYSSFEFEKIT
jgi:mRNA (guanine-N7-)-methyltransferase